MALIYGQYLKGAEIPSPVYIDANVWVSHFISARPKHATSSTALGDLLIQCDIIVSTVVFSEICWAILEHIYNEERKSQNAQTPLTRLSPSIMKRNSAWLLPLAEPKLKEVLETIVSLVSVKMVPPNTKPMKILPTVIVSHSLTSSDAVHLSLASSFAKSFFTEDDDFAGLTDPWLSLAIFIV